MNQPYSDLNAAKAAGLPVDRFPKTSQEASRAEDMLAAGLEQMSLQDHEKILFEIHGFDSLLQQEEPAVVDKKLQELAEEIAKIPAKDTLPSLATKLMFAGVDFFSCF